MRYACVISKHRLQAGYAPQGRQGLDHSCPHITQYLDVCQISQALRGTPPQTPCLSCWYQIPPVVKASPPLLFTTHTHTHTHTHAHTHARVHAHPLLLRWGRQDRGLTGCPQYIYIWFRCISAQEWMPNKSFLKLH